MGYQHLAVHERYQIFTLKKAELTWALIMAASRHIPFEVARLKAGHRQSTLGCQVRGRRLGIWSYGKIGKVVAGYGRAFGMQVWVWGREASKAAACADGVEAAPSREAFFPQATWSRCTSA